MIFTPVIRLWHVDVMGYGSAGGRDETDTLCMFVSDQISRFKFQLWGKKDFLQ